MKKKLTKLVIIGLGLLISPMIVLGVIGSIYILFLFIGGSSLGESFHSFLRVIISLKPYFHYFTFLPMVILWLTFLIRKRPFSKSKGVQ